MRRSLGCPFGLAAAFGLAIGLADAPGKPSSGPPREGPPAGVTADWWSAVREEIARSEYRITWQEHAPLPGLSGAYHATNRAQGFRTYFTDHGIRVVPRTPHRDEAPTWEWSLSLAGWRREGGPLRPAAAARVRVDGHRLEYHRADLVEWYVNDARGLEQGFTMARRPSGSPGSHPAGRNRPVRVELAVGGTVRAALAQDGRAVDFLAPGGARAIRFDHLRVVDARGRELPSRFELGPAAPGPPLLALVVDDRRAAYPVTIDPLATSPAWTVGSDQLETGLGEAVATAGDVNGDGFSDVVVGAHLYDNGQTDEGRVFVYHGSASGLSLTAAWTAEGNQASAFFGSSVATAGDVNGDGFSDVIVGAPGFNSGQIDEGLAFVYHGSASGLAAASAWSAEGNQAFAGFGDAVATAGDVNGDGFSDVIVGAPGFDNGQDREGRAVLYHGSASGLASSHAWSPEGNQTGARLGGSVAAAGDVNGDGFGDVIVGAPGFSNGQSGEGRAFVHHGAASGLATTAAWTAEGDQALAGFGASVATAGDVNGDGFSDVIVGAPAFSNDESGEGRAFVYHGSTGGLALSAAWTAEGDQAGAGFGGAVATAGDVNGDGFGDVVVGAPSYDVFLGDEGRALVYRGSASGLGRGFAWAGEDGQLQSAFGTSVATAGDVNGDGFSDVIVGAPAPTVFPQARLGRAYLFHGAAEGPGRIPGWDAGGDQPDARLGTSVATAGDVNGDGFGDVIVGAPLFDSGQSDEGRVFVYHGSAGGLSPTAGWTAESNQAFAQFGASVAAAGDVNGDGFGDVIVGAPFFDDARVDEGRAFVYHGSAAGLGVAPAWTADGDQAEAGLGASVATAGDVNGDGFGDVIVGAWGFDNGQSDEGRAFVHHGSAAGLSAAAAWTAESNQAFARLGESVATAGDVDGDGFSDVIVGVPLFDGAQSDEGRVLVYHGSAAGLGPSAGWFTEGNQPSARFGTSVASAGDVNGDGFSDVIVGAPLFNSGQIDEGRAFVYHGSPGGVRPIAAWTAESDQSLAELGHSVASAGDVDGDGFSDVIVGAHRFTNSQTDEGRALVYLGSAGGLSLAAAWTAERDQGFAEFGRSVASAGDVNGDGFAEVIVGARSFDDGQTDEGKAFLFYGNRGLGRRTLPRQQRTDGVTPIAPLGRSDSETQFRIRAFMLSIYGRTRLQMEHELKPRGAVFDGLGTSSGSFFDIGNDGEIGFNRLVTGLSPGTLYHWRVRAKYDLARTPFQRNGPWVQVPTRGWNEADLRTAGVPVSVAFDPPARFELRAAGPNPGRGRCAVLLAMPRAGRVQAEVLDVLGRTVAVLAGNEAYEAGAHRLTWDGRSRSGSAAGAGTYFVRVRVGGETRVRKAVLLR